ncbi:hypothetical protein B5M43_010290 [Microbacterium sp. MEC084]|nr:hypothetical protein [Microbacterium sp. MEC084]
MRMETLRELSEVIHGPIRELPAALSRLLAPGAGHRALTILAADVDGGHRRGAGESSVLDQVPYLDLVEMRRRMSPGTVRRDTMVAEGAAEEVLLALSRNGALLALAGPTCDAEGERAVLDLWNIVSLRVQRLADTAPPSWLRLARMSAGERMEALTELADEYSTTLETVLAALRSRALDDAAARTTATGIAAAGLVHLRTVSDRVRTVAEEPVTTAFERLRDDLGPLVRYREIDMQFVEPPLDGRPLPSEVAHGARAVVRGTILAMLDDPEVGRVRVQWDCDGKNLLIDMRDDGEGGLSRESIQYQLVEDRIQALRGRIALDATPGWGTDLSIVIPLDPPHAPAGLPADWALGAREQEILVRVAAGLRNREIAAELTISENTVKFHLANVYRKLGVSSRAEATALYFAQARQDEPAAR